MKIKLISYCTIFCLLGSCFFVTAKYIENDLISSVNTNDWVINKQITKKQKITIEKFIDSTPLLFKEKFDVKPENKGFKINFPVILIIARKLKMN